MEIIKSESVRDNRISASDENFLKIKKGGTNPPYPETSASYDSYLTRF